MQSLAPYLDHTHLKPEATTEQIRTLCDEARRHRFAAVCVNGTHVQLAAELLTGSGVKPIAVVGFPLGAGTSASKAFEASDAVRNGAQEIDMVMNIGAMKDGNATLVEEDIRAVVDSVSPVPVKVILETGLLAENEIILACQAAKRSGAAFVKTSTGFGPGGATIETVKLMRQTVGETMGVKASGGVRSLADAEAMIAAGANRLGASASVAIVSAGKAGQGSY